MGALFKFIFHHKKRIFVFIFLICLTCFSFYLIYNFVSPKKEICSLKQDYYNYTNNIKVTIIGNEATVVETFNSKYDSVINYKDLEYRNNNYYVVNNKKNLVATKRINGNNLKQLYIDSGYNCDNKKNEIDIDFSVKDNYKKIEVKTLDDPKIEKALIAKKDYSNKVIIDDKVDYNSLGTYIISYKLNISKYRSEYIYQVIDVVDTTAPIIKLEGSGSYDLVKGNSYKELGYSVKDNYDDIESIKINIENNIDTNKVGFYKIIYTALDTSGNEAKTEKIVTVRDKNDGLSFFDGILVVNKKCGVNKNYGNGLLEIVSNAYNELSLAAKKDGYDIPLLSGFRDYEYQEKIYNKYIKKYGKELTDTFSAPPGHSEHQTGLAMDVGKIDDDYGETKEGIWLKNNAYKYGFIIRYPKDKETITGYKYEPWHIRYLGIDTATKVYNSGLTLEEYLKIS